MCDVPSLMASKSLRETVNQYPRGKLVAVASCIGILISSGIFVQKYRAQAHDNIPMLLPEEWSSIQGHLPLILRIRKHFTKWLCGAIEKAGFPSAVCMSRSPFNEQIVFITDPRHIQSVFETNFERATKSADLQQRMYELIGDGIFGVNGEKWRFH